MIRGIADFKDPVARRIIEEFRKKVSTGYGFGVTVQGNRVALRWGDGEDLKQISFVILDVDDGKPEPEDPELDK